MTDPLAQWLDEMEAKCRAATPGPWEAIYPDADEGDIRVQRYVAKERQRVLDELAIAWKLKASDAAYIAALPPETVQALLDCVRALDVTRGQWIHSVNAPQCLEALARLRRLALGDA